MIVRINGQVFVTSTGFFEGRLHNIREKNACERTCARACVCMCMACQSVCVCLCVSACVYLRA